MNVSFVGNLAQAQLVWYYCSYNNNGSPQDKHSLFVMGRRSKPMLACTRANFSHCHTISTYILSDTQYIHPGLICLSSVYMGVFGTLWGLSHSVCISRNSMCILLFDLCLGFACVVNYLTFYIQRMLQSTIATERCPVIYVSKP